LANDAQEGSMRVLDTVKAVAASLAAGIAQRRRRSDAVCGECERWKRCGLPPSRNCIVMAAQLARDGGRPAKRPILTQ
jgi:hypothetical protein